MKNKKIIISSILSETSQVLNTVIKEEPFCIDKQWIREYFNVEYNKERVSWYFNYYSKEKVEKK